MGNHNAQKVQSNSISSANFSKYSSSNIEGKAHIEHVASELDQSEANGTSIPPGTVETPKGKEDDAPQFFNYHEFSETFYADYKDPGCLKEHDFLHAISITHFPNVYVPSCSEAFKRTRIVRIPRNFEASLGSPYFSTVLPGFEPAAFTSENDEEMFIPRGIYDDDQVFGCNSISPLSSYITQARYEEIVKDINDILAYSFQVYSWYNILDVVLGSLTLGIWSWLSKYICPNRKLFSLELYVEQVNQTPLFKSQGIQIISPRRSGYLSLDFQIPMPPLPDGKIA
ncbi:Shr5p NDAI_0G04070 [Naumovozyma dairenensis CBS 421]|uniref:Ras modification protein ERF4 n=1 Tax=Naumovozyma dairenensis (strain ATCC 10597 / BCRC 20456 / CBS 421 / NBRC 0211 / NRRL Y-12639) TaxID=1071378 RepID=J7RT63_NAUDC|nr:hypothetical protein NDAI_0G04070 [Naumovozyma dairenensis CBS 421]CCK73392.1 hypothetical protein NDAI_0G04070 [Naumovozyma dairenensis CBS 421]